MRTKRVPGLHINFKASEHPCAARLACLSSQLPSTSELCWHVQVARNWQQLMRPQLHDLLLQSLHLNHRHAHSTVLQAHHDMLASCPCLTSQHVPHLASSAAASAYSTHHAPCWGLLPNKTSNNLTCVHTHLHPKCLQDVCRLDISAATSSAYLLFMS